MLFLLCFVASSDCLSMDKDRPSKWALQQLNNDQHIVSSC